MIPISRRIWPSALPPVLPTRMADMLARSVDCNSTIILIAQNLYSTRADGLKSLNDFVWSECPHSAQRHRVWAPATGPACARPARHTPHSTVHPTRPGTGGHPPPALLPPAGLHPRALIRRAAAVCGAGNTHQHVNAQAQSPQRSAGAAHHCHPLRPSKGSRRYLRSPRPSAPTHRTT